MTIVAVYMRVRVAALHLSSTNNEAEVALLTEKLGELKNVTCGVDTVL